MTISVVQKMIGQTISHYKILEKLGEGGMGVVYKAEDTKLKRIVALKFLSPFALGSAAEKARFVHEAQAAAALNHPNICTIYEIDEAEGQAFIAMEFVDGQSLKEKVASGMLQVANVIDIAIQIAEGLQAAHEKGITHRDIKPANVMITTKGQAKITDFGLAKLTGRSRVTREGMTVGTIAYMSPEQGRGEEVDQRADIWSLGVVLYEMVTGQLPFKGEYEQAVVYSILNEEPEPLTGLRSGVPMELERIVLKALAKSPDERYQHADELLTDLRKFKKQLASGKETAPAPFSRAGQEAEKKPAWRRMMPAILGGLAVILLLLALQRVFRSDGARQVAAKEKSIAVLPLTTITQSEEDEIFSDGMHDDIITQLAKIHDLKVIARTSVMQYKNTQKRISEIGKELEVAAILEGSVRRAGNRVRIVAQLVDAESEEHLWADTYDRDYADVFAIQSDVAQQIALALKATLTPEEKQEIDQIPTDNMKAWEYYQRGNYYWKNYDTVEGNEEAVRMYEKAAQEDPDFALAWARLSIVHSTLASWSETDTLLRKKHLPAAKSTLDKAVSLNPSHPLVHYARGDYHLGISKDYEKALKEFQLALQKQPHNDEIYNRIGQIFLLQRKMDQAAEYFEKEFELDPQGINSGLWVSLVYLYSRNWPEAKKWADRYVATHPEHGFAYTRKAAILMWGFGDLENAGSVIEEGRPFARNHPEILLWHTELKLNFLLCSRAYQEARDFLESDLKIGQKPIWKGFIHTLMGDDLQAKAQYDSARMQYENLVRSNPAIAEYHSSLGLAYAGLGRKEEAIREGQKAVELYPIQSDIEFKGERWLSQLAYIHIMVGEYNQAIDELETLLSIPSQLTVWRLKLDPWYDPLRDLPRFQKLLDKYSEKG
jgi:TolB-like protein/Tfp pilus assembly protein PilF/predicted Ser/Thr protein kinase